VRKCDDSAVKFGYMAATRWPVSPQDWHTPGENRQTPWGPLQWLDTGVMGYVETLPGAMLVYWIEATAPGSGHVGRYLDRLPTDRVVLFVDVLNPTLAGMLHRRGFTYLDDGSNNWGRSPTPTGA
jgi:hypothetical protein